MLNLYRKRLKLSYPKYQKVNIFILGILILTSAIYAQNNDSTYYELTDSTQVQILDSLNQSMLDPADTVQTSLWPALIRSAIIPGWGQIEQEHPARAITFYGLSLACLYNIAYQYHWYNKTNDNINMVKLRRYTIAFLNVYALNLADVIINYEYGNDKPWPQDMYSDIPLRSPWGAVTRSAMLPGWGQCYNESYVKSVVAFGTFFYFASQIYSYEKQYRETDDIFYRDKRVTNTWYLGLTYFLIMVDAYIDAYLFKFDEMIQFSYQYLPEEKTFTLGVNVVF